YFCFLNVSSTTEIYTLSLHDALPISGGRQGWEVAFGLLIVVAVLVFAGWQWLHENRQRDDYASGVQAISNHNWEEAQTYFASARSEEHTSELQSLAYLVCRLLLEKKK